MAISFDPKIGGRPWRVTRPCPRDGCALMRGRAALGAGDSGQSRHDAAIVLAARLPLV